jgi:putative tricarboxylic transport membrane protein
MCGAILEGPLIPGSNLLRVLALTLGTALTAAEGGAQPRFDQLRIVAPAAPGGGWDQTARAMQQALQRSGLVSTPIVENIAGAAGTIGLARFIGAERGNGDALLVSGLIMLGGIVMHDSPVTLADVTPIARLTGEYEVLTVPTSSPFRTFGEFLSAFKASPESISWGGGSAGGSDEILAGLIASAVGVEPRRVNYIAFSGGGEALAAILGGQVSVGVNGLAEFAAQIEAGTVRVLAISSAERLPGVDAPTLREQGVNVELENWRSVAAPPGIDAAERARLEAIVEAMVRSPEWREMLERFRWIDRYLPAREFAAFAASEERRVRDVLRDLGAVETSANRWQPYPALVLAGFVLLGITVATRALRERTEQRVAAREPRWRSLGLIGIGVALSLALADAAGFVIAAALLFWFVARAFDTRHPMRDAVCAGAVALGAYALFTYALELPLPAGMLATWL